MPNGGNVKAAVLVGQSIAQKAREKGIEKVAFDRSGYKYHGRVKALAEAAHFAAFAGLGDKLTERADRLTLQQRKAARELATVAAKDECISFDMCQWQSTGENTGVCKPK
jgi:hypothetical protein